MNWVNILATFRVLCLHYRLANSYSTQIEITAKSDCTVSYTAPQNISTFISSHFPVYVFFFPKQESPQPLTFTAKPTGTLTWSHMPSSMPNAFLRLSSLKLCCFQTKTKWPSCSCLWLCCISSPWPCCSSLPWRRYGAVAFLSFDELSFVKPTQSFHSKSWWVWDGMENSDLWYNCRYDNFSGSWLCASSKESGNYTYFLDLVH